jgi:hypothetical protein
MNRALKFTTTIFTVLTLASCASAQLMLKKSDLDVQTKMSASIFLEPVSPDKRIAFVNVRNTTDKTLEIESKIKCTLRNKGYVLVEDPAKANFMLQVNVLKLGKSDLTESQSALGAGFEGAVAGSMMSGSRNSAVAGGLLGFLGSSLVEDVFFSMITDIQVRERPLEGESIVQKQNTRISQGTGTQLRQNISGGKVNWKTYRSRIVSTANKVNLKFEEAQSELESGLIRSISGVF